jgi:hypothetical protein
MTGPKFRCAEGCGVPVVLHGGTAKAQTYTKLQKG